jgi:hypothetical protein
VQSKDCTAASRTRFAHAPPRQHGLRSYFLCSSDSEHSRGKTLVFPRLRQFSVHKLSCQMNFWKMMNFLLTTLSKFAKTLHVSAPSLPRHNSSTELPSELLFAPLFWVHRGGLVPQLQPLYDGPYAVLRRGPPSFTIRVGWRDEVVAVSRLKACIAADATAGSPRRRSRASGSHSGCLATTKRVSFSDPLVSSPSSSQAPPRDGLRTVFLPGEEVFARSGPAAPSQVPQMRYPSHQRAPLQRLDL